MLRKTIVIVFWEKHNKHTDTLSGNEEVILSYSKELRQVTMVGMYLLPIQSTVTRFCHLLSDALIMNKKIPFLKFETQETKLWGAEN